VVGAGEWVTAAGTAEGLAAAMLYADADADEGAGEGGAGAPPQPASAQHPASALAAASACLAMVTDISGSRLSALMTS
jgi:hypothetical protein